MVTLLIILQAGINITALLQLSNYIFIAINALYTVFMTLIVRPAYKEHVIMYKDYELRKNPDTISTLKKIADKEEQEYKEIVDFIKKLDNKLDLINLEVLNTRHEVNGLRQDKNNLNIMFESMESLTNSMNNLSKNLNK